MYLKQQLEGTLEQLSSLGYDTRELVFARPCELTEVQVLEHGLGFALPPSSTPEGA